MSTTRHYPEVPQRCVSLQSASKSSPNKSASPLPSSSQSSSSKMHVEFHYSHTPPKPTKDRAAPPPPATSNNYSSATSSHSSMRENEAVSDNNKRRSASTTARILSQKPSVNERSSVGGMPSSSSSVFNRIALLPATLKRNSTFMTQSKKPLACQKWTCFQVTEFLDACGLGAYSQLFEEQGVDGSILLELTPDQIERGMHMDNALHMISLITAVQLLMEGKIKRMEDWEWTATKTSEWLAAKGLECLVDRFQHFAVHGGVLFQLTQDEFIDELGVNNPMLLMSLMTSIDRAREVGPIKFGDAIPDWSLSQVKLWLEGLSLAHLHSVFRTFGVNGALLLHLDRDMMTHEMGLTEIQAMVLEKGIAKLQKQAAADSNRWFGRRIRIKSITGSNQQQQYASSELPYALPYPQNSSAQVNAVRRPTLT